MDKRLAFFAETQRTKETHRFAFAFSVVSLQLWCQPFHSLDVFLPFLSFRNERPRRVSYGTRSPELLAGR
jgi:hypothetical protein